MKTILFLILIAFNIHSQSLSDFLFFMGDDAFNPTKVSSATLSAWWEAGVNYRVSGGGANDTVYWTDKTTNARVLTCALTIQNPSQITSGVNGHASLRFDGTNNKLGLTFTNNQPCTYYVVMKQITWTDGDYIWDGKIGTNAVAIIAQRGLTPELNMLSNTAWTNDNTDLAVNTWGVVYAYYNGASSKLRINNNAATTGNPGSTNPEGFTIGSAGGGAFCSNIEVAEILIYAGTVSSADDVLIMKYLNSKYNIY